MSKKSLTRFVAEAGGELYPLISVREAANGTLIIKPKRSRFNHQEDGVFETRSQKLTVHKPNERGNFTVHHTLESLGSPKIDTHQVSSALESGGIQLLYSHTLGNLTAGPPSQDIRQKDRIVKISQYEPTHSVLHVLLFVGGPEISIDVLEDRPVFERWVVNFRRFSLIVITGYSLLPSQEIGWITHRATAPLTIDGVRQGEPFDVSAGIPPERAGDISVALLMEQHADVFLRAVAILSQRPEDGVATNPKGFERLLLNMYALGVQKHPFIPSHKR